MRRVRVVAAPVADGCDCAPPCAGVGAAFGFLSVALPLTELAGGVAFALAFCASADAGSARTSAVMKINFLNITGNTSL